MRGGQQTLDADGGERPAVAVALPMVAVQRAQDLRLFFVLDAFGNDGHAKIVRELAAAPDQGPQALVLDDGMDERADG